MPRQRAHTVSIPLFSIFQKNKPLSELDAFLKALKTTAFNKIALPKNSELLQQAVETVLNSNSANTKQRETLFKAILFTKNYAPADLDKLKKPLLALFKSIYKEGNNKHNHLLLLNVISNFSSQKSFQQQLEFIYNVLEAQFISMPDLLKLITSIKLRENYDARFNDHQSDPVAISSIIKKIGTLLLTTQSEIDFETPARLLIDDTSQLTNAEKKEYELFVEFITEYPFLLPAQVTGSPLLPSPLTKHVTPFYETTTRERAMSEPLPKPRFFEIE